MQKSSLGVLATWLSVCSSAWAPAARQATFSSASRIVRVNRSSIARRRSGPTSSRRGRDRPGHWRIRLPKRSPIGSRTPSCNRPPTAALDPAIFQSQTFVSDGLRLNSVVLTHESTSGTYWILFCPPAVASTRGKRDGRSAFPIRFEPRGELLSPLWNRREALAALASTATVPILHGCRNQAAPPPAATGSNAQADAVKLLDEIGEN